MESGVNHIFVVEYGNKSSYRCHNGHVSRIRGEELKSALLDIARNMALAQLQEFELKTDGGNCPDNLEREIESLKKSKAHYAKLKFEIYDDYTKANITRDQMAKKTAEVKQKIAEIESLITQKQETLDMQKDLFLDAKQEQLTKLSMLDEFDEEVIRYLMCWYTIMSILKSDGTLMTFRLDDGIISSNSEKTKL